MRFYFPSGYFFALFSAVFMHKITPIVIGSGEFSGMEISGVYEWLVSLLGLVVVIPIVTILYVPARYLIRGLVSLSVWGAAVGVLVSLLVYPYSFFESVLYDYIGEWWDVGAVVVCLSFSMVLAIFMHYLIKWVGRSESMGSE